MPRSRRQVCLSLLVSALTLSLCGCGSGTSLMDRLDLAGELPLWQKVTAIAFATLISEDMACIAAGLLVSEGAIPFIWGFLGGFLGIFFGDLLLYVIGRIGGLALLRRIPFRWLIKENQIVQAEYLFQEHGGKLIFSSRLLPGSRLPIYAAAGVLNYSFWKFCVFMAIAGGLSALILVWASRHLGEVVLDWLRVYEVYAIPVFIVAALIVYLVVKLVEILATRRSRLIFLARCRKLYYRISGNKRQSRPNSG